MAISDPGFYAIMGQSGSGKSTLLHLLAALDRPDQGQITVGGTPIHDLDEKRATLFRRKGVGIVFQQYNLLPTLTARQNVELPGMLAGETADFLSRRSAELLTRDDEKKGGFCWSAEAAMGWKKKRWRKVAAASRTP